VAPLISVKSSDFVFLADYQPGGYRGNTWLCNNCFWETLASKEELHVVVSGGEEKITSKNFCPIWSFSALHSATWALHHRLSCSVALVRLVRFRFCRNRRVRGEKGVGVHLATFLRQGFGCHGVQTSIWGHRGPFKVHHQDAMKQHPWWGFC